MTSNTIAPSEPFLLRYADLLPAQPAHVVRYDSKRQVSEVMVGDQWIDACEAVHVEIGATRLTRVRAETTDDE